jgi:hypothetical protein
VLQIEVENQTSHWLNDTRELPNQNIIKIDNSCCIFIATTHKRRITTDTRFHNLHLKRDEITSHTRTHSRRFMRGSVLLSSAEAADDSFTPRTPFERRTGPPGRPPGQTHTYTERTLAMHHKMCVPCAQTTNIASKSRTHFPAHTSHHNVLRANFRRTATRTVGQNRDSSVAF